MRAIKIAVKEEKSALMVGYELGSPFAVYMNIKKAQWEVILSNITSDLSIDIHMFALSTSDLCNFYTYQDHYYFLSLV